MILITEGKAPHFTDVLYLLALGLGATYVAGELAVLLPELPPVLSASTWRILLITSFGIALSFTRARNIPGSHALAMALIYLFVARMGASTNLEGVAGKAVEELGRRCLERDRGDRAPLVADRHDMTRADREAVRLFVDRRAARGAARPVQPPAHLALGVGGVYRVGERAERRRALGAKQ